MDEEKINLIKSAERYLRENSDKIKSGEEFTIGTELAKRISHLSAQTISSNRLSEAELLHRGSNFLSQWQVLRAKYLNHDRSEYGGFNAFKVSSEVFSKIIEDPEWQSSNGLGRIKLRGLATFSAQQLHAEHLREVPGDRNRQLNVVQLGFDYDGDLDIPETFWDFDWDLEHCENWITEMRDEKKGGVGRINKRLKNYLWTWMRLFYVTQNRYRKRVLKNLEGSSPENSVMLVSQRSLLNRNVDFCDNFGYGEENFNLSEISSLPLDRLCGLIVESLNRYPLVGRRKVEKAAENRYLSVNIR